MIVYPEGWETIGQPIHLNEIAYRLMLILRDIPCNCLSLSGGIDSSLLLYFMLQVKPEVKVFTIGLSEDHPDVKYATQIVDKFSSIFPKEVVTHKIYVPWPEKIEREKQLNKSSGDMAVRMFYKFVGQHTDGIIAGDGIDEYMCGYYSHEENPSEENYYSHIRRLNKEHLIPLDKNSGNVKVYLPFLDDRLISLLSQIPVSEKVDITHRKKLMVELAKGRLPDEIVMRRKYGFCDAFTIKE